MDLSKSSIFHNIKKNLTLNASKARGGGGTLVFSYIHRLGSFFGLKILNFNIFDGFQINEYFLG